MKEAVIVAAVRTAIGDEGGALRNVPQEHYAAHVMKTLVQRTGVNPEEIEDVYWGNQQGVGRIARNSLLMAGLPVTVPGMLMNRACSSSIQAICLASQSIQCDQGDVYIAGGSESLSRAPYHLLRPTEAFQRTPPQWVGTSGEPVGDPSLGLHMPMGITAENVATEYGISREEMDRFALRSHQRALAAMDAGLLKEQIVPFPVPQRRGDPVVFDTDEHPRRDTSAEALARLRPAFKEGGLVTAGNSCANVDAAAATLLTTRERAREMGLESWGTVRAWTVVGVHPRIMGIGPVPAIRKLLTRVGMEMSQIDLIEINEAFAAQVLACANELGMDLEKTNVNGGAIAHGHPIGATGAILTTKLLHEMKRRQLRWGLVTQCIGGGMGIAALFERV